MKSKSETLGRRLRAERRRLGMRQVDLSAKSGVPQGTISRLENDLRRPLVDTLLKLAAAGVDAARVLGV